MVDDFIHFGNRWYSYLVVSNIAFCYELNY